MRCSSLLLLLLLGCSSRGSGDKPADPKPTLQAITKDAGVVAPAPTPPSPVGDDVVSPPTSEALIQRGLADGKLDAKTAALYQLLARYSPGRIPDPYWAPNASDS